MERIGTEIKGDTQDRGYFVQRFSQAVAEEDVRTRTVYECC